MNMGEISDAEIHSALDGRLLRVDLHKAFDPGAWIPMRKICDRLVMHDLWTSDVSSRLTSLNKWIISHLAGDI